MTYIDGFLIPVATNRREEYRAHELKWWPMFREAGALTLVAGWGDDVPAGKQTDFRRAVDLREDETVVLCWMTWPDRETRDKGMASIMQQMGDTPPPDMPFDGKRMVFGGFALLIDAD